MSEFYADPAVGGDSSRTTDDDNPNTGLGQGGFWTRLVPMFRNVVAIANYVRERAITIAQQAQIASNAADTAVSAANSAVAKATITDQNPIVQGATDGSRQVRLEVTSYVPTNRTVVLSVPAEGGIIATKQYVETVAENVARSSLANAKRQATALTF